MPATVMVATTAPIAQQANPPGGPIPLRRSLPGFGMLAAGLVVGTLSMPSRRPKNAKNSKKLSRLASLLLFLVSCAGCGGASMGSGPPPPPPQPGTPQGIYMLNVTGASGSTSQSVTITLTVQ